MVSVHQHKWSTAPEYAPEARYIGIKRLDCIFTANKYSHIGSFRMAGPIIRLKDLMSHTGLSRSAIYDRMDKNSPRYAEDFPKSFSLSGGAVGWFKVEIDAWLEACAANGKLNMPPKKKPLATNANPAACLAASPTASSESKKPPQKAGREGAGTSRQANAPLPSHRGSKTRNLAETIVQGGQVNDRLRHFLQLKTWTPIMGALLISGIDAPQDCNAVPDQGVGLDGKPLPPGDSRIAEAHRVLREWRDWQEDTNDQALELHPVAFLNWCVNDEINTEWLTLFLELNGFVDSKKIDLTSSRFALLTGR